MHPGELTFSESHESDPPKYPTLVQLTDRLPHPIDNGWIADFFGRHPRHILIVDHRLQESRTCKRPLKRRPNVVNIHEIPNKVRHLRLERRQRVSKRSDIVGTVPMQDSVSVQGELFIKLMQKLLCLRNALSRPHVVVRPLHQRIMAA